jgi:hypothetical protein
MEGLAVELALTDVVVDGELVELGELKGEEETLAETVEVLESVLEELNVASEL